MVAEDDAKPPERVGSFPSLPFSFFISRVPFPALVTLLALIHTRERDLKEKRALVGGRKLESQGGVEVSRNLNQTASSSWLDPVSPCC